MPGDNDLQTGTSEAQAGPPPGRFQCTDCQKSFGRVEHLSRHAQSHSKERSYKCPRCRKGFYRLDALMRHEKTHQNPEEQPGGRVSRACLACSTARRKCSRGLPCSACVQRSIECVFPASSSKLPEQFVAGGWRDQIAGPFRGIERHVEPIRSPASWSNNATASEESHPDYDCAYVSPANGDAQFSTNMERDANQIMDISQDSYQEHWLQTDFSSINWLPDDWTPAFADATGLNSSARPAQTVPANQSDVGGTSEGAHVTNTRRHWVQSNTPRESISSEHTSSTPHSQLSTGRLYVDGDGARLPRIRKELHQYDEASTQDSNQDDQSQGVYGFPDIESPHWSYGVAVHQSAQLPQESYDQIFRAFQSTCITSNHFRVYYTSNFPSISFISQCVRLYMEHLQPILPFVHTASFNIHSTHWLLVLAFGAIGSLYIDGNSKEHSQCSLAMLEFLRRAILAFEECENITGLDTLRLSQVKLLSCVGSMYCGNQPLIKAAKSKHGDLVEFCKTEWVQADSPEEISRDVAIAWPAVHNRWKSWHESESRRRTGYCIWLLDCMWALHFQITPLLALEDATVAVPCQEVLWEADSALDWEQLYSVSTDSLSLHSTMQRAYIEKQVQSSTGEFTRILCIHSIIQRTWAVESYFKKPLSVWNPTAERQEIETITKMLPIWLPGIPTYSRWRNSACDVLDCYHWHANAVIGAASGMEHPTVLHLHLARVILLTPYREIVKLTHLLTEETNRPPRSDETTKLRRHIQRWALEDQFKARLAMIHAGVLFWHVRRYSTDAFHEPSSVFLATLALWAYGTFAPNTLAEDSDDEGRFPTSMQLDRPADDELVQLFIKRGAAMKAKITGVGNLCSEKGPGRILIEGKKLLTGLRRWGVETILEETLNSLIEKDLEKNDQVGA